MRKGAEQTFKLVGRISYPSWGAKLEAKYKLATIGGTPLSGKSTVAKGLAEATGWRLISAGQVWREAWRERFPDQEITFEEFWRSTTLEENRQLDEKFKGILEEGEGIIAEGRYIGARVSGDKHLKAFVTAPLETRAARLLKRGDSGAQTIEEARETILKREEDEREKYCLLYPDKPVYWVPENNHITVDTGALTPEQAVAAVMEALMRKD